MLHASGTEAGLRSALELAARDATVLELSWFGETGESSVTMGGRTGPQLRWYRSLSLPWRPGDTRH